MRRRANNAERSLRNTGNAAGDVLGRRVRDGVEMTAGRSSPIAKSACSTMDPDAQVRRAANGALATIIKRLRAKREERRREQREFKAWLQITATPL
jgi:hypothetical protein